jgi:methionine biosynthesis protein MetW
MDQIAQKKSEKPRRYYENSREEMLRYIPAGVHKTLEFGCGCGHFSELLKRTYGTESWGVEIDEESVASARQKLDRVVKGDAMECLAELPDGYFDVIILNDILEHLVDPFRLLDRVRWKLTRDGVIVSSIPNVRYWDNLWHLLWEADWTYKKNGILDITHLRFFTYKTMVRMFQDLGYEILRMEGLCPTRNRRYRALNLLLMNRLWDARYVQFACVVKPYVAGCIRCSGHPSGQG